MADCMIFPKTVDEFMEEYKIVDSEQIYTNGTELVPIFRMKQWFEHLSEDVQSVRHGHLVGLWYDGYADGNPVYEEWECSECGSVYEGEDIDFNFCPNCGVQFKKYGEQSG